jgi:hypothetical protein
MFGYLFMDKKGKISIGAMISTLVIGLVMLLVLFKVAAAMIPEAQSAGDELNQSGVPLGSLFVGGGVVFIIVMVSILIAVIMHFLPSSRK